MSSCRAKSNSRIFFWYKCEMDSYRKGRLNYVWGSIPHWRPPVMQRLKLDSQLSLMLNSCWCMLTLRAQQHCQVLLCHAEQCWLGQGRCLCRHTFVTWGDKLETKHYSVVTVDGLSHCEEKMQNPYWISVISTHAACMCWKAKLHSHTVYACVHTSCLWLSPFPMISAARVLLHSKIVNVNFNFWEC